MLPHGGTKALRGLLGGVPKGEGFGMILMK
jgi:hypothetical protein